VEGFWLKKEDRTLESNATKATSYESEAGGDRTKLKNYDNVEKQVCSYLLLLNLFNYLINY